MTLRNDKNIVEFFANACLDNDYIILIINKQFFKKFLSNYQIHIISISIIIREIDVAQHVLSNYVLFNLWLFDNEFDDFVIIHITREMHLINELRVNLLINMNIQKLENITISISKSCFYIDNYVEFIATINIINVEKRVDRLIRIKKIIFLSFYFVTNMFIQIRDNFYLSIDKNYMFHSKINFELKSKNDVYFYIVDVNMSIIQIRNIINETYIVSRHVKLNRVLDYEKKIVVWQIRKTFIWLSNSKNKYSKTYSN